MVSAVLPLPISPSVLMDLRLSARVFHLALETDAEEPLSHITAEQDTLAPQETSAAQSPVSHCTASSIDHSDELNNTHLIIN